MKNIDGEFIIPLMTLKNIEESEQNINNMTFLLIFPKEIESIIFFIYKCNINNFINKRK